MYRAALRSTSRATRSASSSTLTSTPRRYLSFRASDKPRTWKGAAVRWGLAIGALYWYNTSPIFADEVIPQTVPAPPQFSDADLPTVESVIEQKRKEAEAKAKKAAPPPPSPRAPSDDRAEAQQTSGDGTAAPTAPTAEPGSPEALEEEASQQGAFNPETGEINWDCPCLGGMADGPCGEEFKAAFSCFVYSTEEPKGMDCIEKFQHMQDCFRQYPEVYGAELGDEEGENAAADAPAGGEGEASPAKPQSASESPSSPTSTADKEKKAPEVSAQPKTGIKAEASAADVKPKEATDATAANIKAQ